MEKTHHRTGDKALLEYTVSKAPELNNPLDPNSGTTGNTCFILNEYYESNAGIADHFEQAQSSWQDFPALVQWMEKCQGDDDDRRPRVQRPSGEPPSAGPREFRASLANINVNLAVEKPPLRPERL